MGYVQYYGPESARPDRFGPPAGSLETAGLTEPADRVVAELQAQGIIKSRAETAIAEIRILQAAGFDLSEIAAVADGRFNHRSSGVVPARAARIGGSVTKLESVGIGPSVVKAAAEAIARDAAPAREVAAATSIGQADWRALREERNPTPASTLALRAGGKILGADYARRQQEGFEAARRHAARESAARYGY